MRAADCRFLRNTVLHKYLQRTCGAVGIQAVLILDTAILPILSDMVEVKTGANFSLVDGLNPPEWLAERVFPGFDLLTLSIANMTLGKEY